MGQNHTSDLWSANLLLKFGFINDLQINILHSGNSWSDLYRSCMQFRWVDSGTPCRNYYAQRCACSRQKNNAICLLQNTLRLRHHTAVSRYCEPLLLWGTRLWLEDEDDSTNNASSYGRREATNILGAEKWWPSTLRVGQVHWKQ
jgi:hypothetical protein